MEYFLVKVNWYDMEEIGVIHSDNILIYADGYVGVMVQVMQKYETLGIEGVSIYTAGGEDIYFDDDTFENLLNEGFSAIEGVECF